MRTVVRAGVDRSSFATVFNEHHRSAVRLAYLLTNDAHQAEDIVADVFAKVYVRWSKGEVRDVGVYLRRAVVNEANSKLRRRYLERAVVQRRGGDDRGVRLLDDGAADHDQVWQAIRRLPERQRKAVVLRYYEDLSEADTADLLGCSVGTVKSQVSRGLARLQVLLAERDVEVRPVRPPMPDDPIPDPPRSDDPTPPGRDRPTHALRDHPTPPQALRDGGERR